MNKFLTPPSIVVGIDGSKAATENAFRYAFTAVEATDKPDRLGR
jgi:hypothetical protein